MDRPTTSPAKGTEFSQAERPSPGVAEIHLTKHGPNGGPLAEVFVAEGTSLKDIHTVEQSIFRELLPRLGLKACEGCRSGLDLRIRERFMDVIRVNVETGKMVGR